MHYGLGTVEYRLLVIQDRAAHEAEALLDRTGALIQLSALDALLKGFNLEAQGEVTKDLLSDVDRALKIRRMGSDRLQRDVKADTKTEGKLRYIEAMNSKGIYTSLNDILSTMNHLSSGKAKPL